MKYFLVLSALFNIFLLGTSAVFAQWSPDIRLTYNDSLSQTSDDYYNARNIAAAPGGFVHIVWMDNRDGNREIYYKRSVNGGGSWSQDVRLTDDPGVSEMPSIAVADSVVHALWQDSRSGSTQIFYKRSLDGGLTWLADTRLDTDSNLSVRPSISALGSLVHAVWEDYRDLRDQGEIYYKRSTDNGSTWGPDTRLTIFVRDSRSPSVLASGTNVHVAWRDDRNNWNEEIYYKRSTDSGNTWGADTRLTINNTASDSDVPSLSASGSVVNVFWQDNRDGNFEIYTKRSTDVGVTWGSDTRLTNAASYSESPSVVAVGTNIHLIWHDKRNANYEIYYKLSTNTGTTWGSDTRLTFDDTSSSWASIAAEGGVLHVVWTDYRDNPLRPEIYYKRNPPSGVEEHDRISGFVEFPTKATPNPFSSFATLPGHEVEHFALYDISGRQVGTYRGDRVGADLVPGVYFLRPMDISSPPVRIVKVR